MTPYDHARLHARDFGGRPEDYLPVDEFLDQTKLHVPDFRHRAILHNAWGMGLAEQVLGPVIINSAGQPVSVRELARRHILQDCGCVPTLKETVLALQLGDMGKYNRPSARDRQWLRRDTVPTAIPEPYATPPAPEASYAPVAEVSPPTETT